MPTFPLCSSILLALLTFGAPRAAHPAPASVPLTLDKDGRMTVVVRAHGAGPFRFRVDTGASRTLVGARLAHRLGLRPAGRSRTTTHAGETVLPMAALDSLTLEDGTTLRGGPVVVVDDDQLDRSRRLDGVLGQDVLCRQPFTLDYIARRLVLGSLPAAGAAGVRLPLTVGEATLVALVAQPGAPEPLRLLPDSGADRIVLFDRPARRLPPLTLIETVLVRSIVGERPARLVRVHELDLGGLRLRDREAVLMDNGPAGRAMGDGLLPLQLFARVSINTAEGYLELEGRP